MVRIIYIHTYVINSHMNIKCTIDIIVVHHKLSSYAECSQTLGNSIKLECPTIMYNITFILMASRSMKPPIDARLLARLFADQYPRRTAATGFLQRCFRCHPPRMPTVD